MAQRGNAVKLLLIAGNDLRVAKEHCGFAVGREPQHRLIGQQVARHQRRLPEPLIRLAVIEQRRIVPNVDGVADHMKGTLHIGDPSRAAAAFQTENVGHAALHRAGGKQYRDMLKQLAFCGQ